MSKPVLSKSNARLLAELLGDHLIQENAKCIHFPHPSHMVKVELLPLPTRGYMGFETITIGEVLKFKAHVAESLKKRRRK